MLLDMSGEGTCSVPIFVTVLPRCRQHRLWSTSRVIYYIPTINRSFTELAIEIVKSCSVKLYEWHYQLL